MEVGEMRNGIDLVDIYLERVRKELFGVDDESKNAIIDELKDNILERARDLAQEDNLRNPTTNVYGQVIDEMGPPNEVIKGYLRDLPIVLPKSVEYYLYVQFSIGIISFVSGITMFRLLIHPSATDPVWTLVVGALIFLLFAYVIIRNVVVQLRKPEEIVRCSNISSTASVCAIVPLILLLMWSMTQRYYSGGGEILYIVQERLFFLVTTLLIIVFMLIFMFGTSQTERLKRRIYLKEN